VHLLAKKALNSLLIIEKDETMASFDVFILNLEANEENECPWQG
jgi:hypothetical protein